MLKAIVSDINTIEENLRSFYEDAGNGKFKLKVESVDGIGLEDVGGLRNALTAERNISSGYKTKLASFEGLDPTSARAAVDRLASFGDIDPAKAKEGLTALERFSKFNPETEAERLAEEKLKNAKAQLTANFISEKTTLETKVSELTEKLTKREQQITQGHKKAVIATELSKLNPLDEARDVLEVMANNDIRMQEINGDFIPVVVDKDGNPRVKLAADYTSVPFSVSDYMAEMRDKRAVLFKADNKAGIGSSTTPAAASESAGQANPYKQGATFNLTQQILLEKNNPTQAARFRSDVGLT